MMDVSLDDSLPSIDGHIKIIECNVDQYLRHKQIIDQHKIYDTNLYHYLSYLNPVNNPNQHQTPVHPNAATNLPFSYFTYGFKYCKWNDRSYFQLLCVINACNQLFLFNLTNHKKANMLINDLKNIDGKWYTVAEKADVFNIYLYIFVLNYLK